MKRLFTFLWLIGLAVSDPVSKEDDPYTAKSEGDCPVELPSLAYVTDARSRCRLN